MTTRREAILAQIATQLASTTGVNGRVYRSRVEPLARGESPALVVEPQQDQATQTTIPRIDWTLTVNVMVIVRSPAPDQAADPVVASLHAKMMQDLTLGGLSYDIQPQNVSFEFIEADQPAGVVTCTYNVLYKTSLSDQTTL
jgi:hypothetical protein